MDVLLCDELRQHLSLEQIAEVRGALARLETTLYFESEAPPHERGDGSSLYHRAKTNWTTPFLGART